MKVTAQAYFCMDLVRVEAWVDTESEQEGSTQRDPIVLLWERHEWPEDDPTELADKLARCLLEWSAGVAEERKERAKRF